MTIYVLTALNDANQRERVSSHASITCAYQAKSKVPKHREPRVERAGYIVPTDGLVREMAILEAQEMTNVSIVKGGDVRRSPPDNCAWVQAWFRVDYSKVDIDTMS